MQRCVGYRSRSAGVIVMMRRWLGRGVHITFSGPVRDAAQQQSDGDIINIIPRRSSISSAVLPFPNFMQP